ncbi:mitochondrial calcium uniporter regulator 1 [Suricata suricatta]|nr:mitochondrial calcium uniporter regulator 1 [Suricata suricatta]
MAATKKLGKEQLGKRSRRRIRAASPASQDRLQTSSSSLQEVPRLKQAYSQMRRPPLRTNCREIAYGLGHDLVPSERSLQRISLCSLEKECVTIIATFSVGEEKLLSFPILPKPAPIRLPSAIPQEGVPVNLINDFHAGDAKLSLSAGSLQLEHQRNVEHKRRDFTSCGNRKLYFDTHALVCLLEENGFTTQQAEITVSALVKITDANMDIVYKDMVTKTQQEITVQQIMSQIANVKKDMIILEKSEFSALRAENEKINLELHRLKQQVMDEVVKVRTDTKLEFNLEKSRVKELYSLNERKLLEMRTEMVALHAQQDRAVTQTDRKIDTEVAGLKTMLESHKLDNIKYLAGSVFTCLTVALGFYRLWM